MLKMIAALLLLPALLPAQGVKTLSAPETKGQYAARTFTAFMQGGVFTFTAANTHTRLYQGYVKNVNLLGERLKELSAAGKADSPEYAELNRRFGWEFNGMRLHEVYFAQFGAAPLAAKSPLREALARQYGSYEAWEKDFLALPAARGIGWAALVYDRQAGRFHNVWLEQHDGGFPAGAEPLLVLDLFEHAFLQDFQLDKPRYVKAVWAALNWAVVEKRFAGR